MRIPSHPYSIPLIALAAGTLVAGAPAPARASGGDPIEGLAWSTYYGDSDTERDTAVATARDGGVFLAGRTYSDHGLATEHAYQITGGGDWDAILVHLDADGARRWATYFGGDDVEQPADLAVSPTGPVYLVGSTRSAAGIAAAGAYRSCIDGGRDGFLVGFDEDGEHLWSTYVGGDDDDELHAVAVDDDGAVYLCGATTSDYGIATGDDVHQPHRSGKTDAFLASFDGDGGMRWSTYFGGTGEDACLALAVHDGRVYFTGRTTSHDHVTSPDAFQSEYRGDEDAFVAVFDRDGARLWSTYHGGPGHDRGEAIAVDDRGEVHVAGTTRSRSGIADSHGLQRRPRGGDDLFLVRFTAGGERVWATYYGGEGDEDRDHGVSLDFRRDDQLYLGGTAGSWSRIATEDSLDERLSGPSDLFVAALDIDPTHGADPVIEPDALASGCDHDDAGGEAPFALLLGIFPIALRRRATPAQGG